jgi:hypothetical protein
MRGKAASSSNRATPFCFIVNIGEGNSQNLSPVLTAKPRDTPKERAEMPLL